MMTFNSFLLVFSLLCLATPFCVMLMRMAPLLREWKGKANERPSDEWLDRNMLSVMASLTIAERFMLRAMLLTGICLLPISLALMLGS